jgi:hypothetical protein
MKITDPQIIQNGEKKLIAAVQEHLDLETVKTILMDRIAEIPFESKGGQIVVHDNQIAFRLDFDLKLNGSLLFDRQGNYIPAPPTSPSLFVDEPFNEDTNRISDSPENGLDDLDSDDTLDDDIDDILKESRDFWEKKKGS